MSASAEAWRRTPRGALFAAVVLALVLVAGFLMQRERGSAGEAANAGIGQGGVQERIGASLALQELPSAAQPEHGGRAPRRSVDAVQEPSEVPLASDVSLASQWVELLDRDGIPLAGLGLSVFYSHATIDAATQAPGPLVADEQGRIALKDMAPVNDSAIGVRLTEEPWVELHIDAIARADIRVKLDRASARFVDGVARVELDLGAWQVEFVDGAGRAVTGVGGLAWTPPKEWLPSSRADLPALAPPNSIFTWRQVRSGEHLWVARSMPGEVLWARLPVGQVKLIAPEVGSVGEPSILQLPVEEGDLLLRGNLGEDAANASVEVAWIEGPQQSLLARGVPVDESGAFELRLQGVQLGSILAVHLFGHDAAGESAFGASVVLWEGLGTMGEQDLGTLEVRALPVVVAGQVVDAEGRTVHGRTPRVLTPAQAKNFELLVEPEGINFVMKGRDDGTRWTARDHLLATLGLRRFGKPSARVDREAHEAPAYLFTPPSHGGGGFTVQGSFDGPLAVVFLDGSEALEVPVGTTDVVLVAGE